MEPVFQKRVLLLCALMVGVFSLLSVRLVYIHVVMHEKYAAIAADRHVHKEVMEARRGTIMERNGELLACNQTIYNVVADRNHLNDLIIACRGLAAAEGISASEVRRKYDRDEIRARYLNRVVRVLAQPLELHGWELRQKLDAKDHGMVVLKKSVEENVYGKLQELVSRECIGGVYFDQTMRRYYPSPRTLTHVLGHVSHEGFGQEGIEKSMDDVMRGVPGYRYIERDRRLREITAYRGETREPINGCNVRLTIDMGLQNILEAALSEAWSAYLPEKISAVFMDPNTGEILAMANRPHFDLGTREGERRNRAICDSYEPGSTFKIVTAGAVFDRGLVNRNTEIFCHYGNYQDGALQVSDHHPYGDLTVEMVIAKSSNIGSYKLARQLGKNCFYDYMKEFGFGQPTGVMLTGESSGRVFEPKDWSLPSFSRMAIGYEVSVTPLQMASALAVIANGGVLLRPRIVDAILDEKGRVLEQFPREELRRVISENAANEVRKILIAVIGPNGTGEAAAVEGVTVAGKTGTARKYSPEAKCYLPGRYVCSFMGFLPAEDPQLLGIVVVDDPQTGALNRYGGTIAAPVFAKVATEAAAYLDLNSRMSRTTYAGSLSADRN